MAEVTPYAPTPGTALPGNLYADLQSRTLWLGVDAAVDPNQAVLISDIVMLQSQIVAGDNAAKAYTDNTLKGNSGLGINPKGYSGLDHMHDHTQIIDFDQAVSGVVTSIPSLQFTRGMIMLWYGQPGLVGVDKLAGWVLCDGTTYTIDGVSVKAPDLRDRFVIGAGAGRLVNSLNPTSSFITDTQGGHTHTLSNVALTTAMLPAHTHPPGTLSGSISGTAAYNGDHAHTWTLYGGGTASANPRAEGTTVAGTGTTTTTGGHTHSVSGSCSVSGGATGSTGSGSTHTHTTSTDGSHYHTITSTQIRDVISSYALCYIMKI